jgi:hypothetical protein
MTNFHPARHDISLIIALRAHTADSDHRDRVDDERHEADRKSDFKRCLHSSLTDEMLTDLKPPGGAFQDQP